MACVFAYCTSSPPLIQQLCPLASLPRERYRVFDLHSPFLSSLTHTSITVPFSVDDRKLPFIGRTWRLRRRQVGRLSTSTSYLVAVAWTSTLVHGLRMEHLCDLIGRETVKKVDYSQRALLAVHHAASKTSLPSPLPCRHVVDQNLFMLELSPTFIKSIPPSDYPGFASSPSTAGPTTPTLTRWVKWVVVAHFEDAQRLACPLYSRTYTEDMCGTHLDAD